MKQVEQKGHWSNQWEELYQANKDDLDYLSKLMAKAFSEDPLWQDLLGSEPQKDVILQILFKAILQYHYQKGIIVATSSDFEGVMVWTPGGKKECIREVIRGTQISLRLLKLLKYLSLKRLAHLLRSLKKWDLYREKRSAQTAHCCLDIIFVQKEFRGKKHSSKLFKALLSHCDSMKLLCFVETNNPANLSIYEHYGFKLKQQCKMGNEQINAYFMEREPVALTV